MSSPISASLVSVKANARENGRSARDWLIQSATMPYT